MIIAVDLADRLLVELSTSELGEAMVDVEIWGTAWRRLARHGDGHGALEDTWTSLTLPGE